MELKLLQMRYTSEEFGAIQRALADDRIDPEIQQVLDLVRQLDMPRPRRNVARSVEPKVDLKSAKKNFVSSLSNGSVRRLQAIARRIGIEAVPADKAKLVSQINSKLDSLPENELKSFLIRSRAFHGPDEGFLGLANYILHRNNETE
ncbi:hypothetical protein [Methylosinus sp. C49]|uniref:hypothetical protein n=1 Tax=Methylosinus sp. C49 TaxID=2699395 RepID=UPI00137AD5A1|nr:hypothetical protein [Methylosinus sp. C49]